MVDEPNPETKAKGHPEDPRNPPNSLLQPETRRTALASYLGPVIALFVVAGIAFLYWANRGPTTPDERNEDTVGTSGDSTPGGFEPEPRLDDTRDELANRGAGTSDTALEPTLNSVRQVISSREQGKRVSLENVEVADVGPGNQYWVREDDSRLAVIAPDGSRAFKRGDRVHVTGVIELHNGAPVVRATRVE